MRDVRTFVRHGARVVELTAARPLIVGRGEGCDLLLDDDLASRQHCRLELIGDRVRVTDLGSRNGVLVNGLPVDSEQEVHHGDLITAGRSQLEVARQEHRPRADSEADAEIAVPRERTSSSVDLTATGNVYDILSGSARMSLEDGDVSSAERSARNLFTAIRSTLARRRTVRDAVFDEAVSLALALGERTRDVSWVDRVLELYVAARRPMPAALAQRVATVAEAAGSAPRALDDYLAFARAADDPSAAILASLAR